MSGFWCHGAVFLIMGGPDGVVDNALNLVLWFSSCTSPWSCVEERKCLVKDLVVHCLPKKITLVTSDASRTLSLFFGRLIWSHVRSFLASCAYYSDQNSTTCFVIWRWTEATMTNLWTSLFNSDVCSLDLTFEFPQFLLQVSDSCSCYTKVQWVILFVQTSTVSSKYWLPCKAQRSTSIVLQSGLLPVFAQDNAKFTSSRCSS